VVVETLASHSRLLLASEPVEIRISGRKTVNMGFEDRSAHDLDTPFHHRSEFSC
jgi:hypothetical protein